MRAFAVGLWIVDRAGGSRSTTTGFVTDSCGRGLLIDYIAPDVIFEDGRVRNLPILGLTAAPVLPHRILPSPCGFSVFLYRILSPARNALGDLCPPPHELRQVVSPLRLSKRPSVGHQEA